MRLEGHDVRRLRAGRVEDPAAQLGTRARARRRGRHRRGDLREARSLLASLLGRREQLVHAGLVVRVQRVERVARDQLVSLGVHDPSDSVSSRSSRRRARPANILLLMVPSGTPSLSASSDCE